jgi:hypothetical protein
MAQESRGNTLEPDIADMADHGYARAHCAAPGRNTGATLDVTCTLECATAGAKWGDLLSDRRAYGNGDGDDTTQHAACVPDTLKHAAATPHIRTADSNPPGDAYAKHYTDGDYQHRNINTRPARRGDTNPINHAWLHSA